MGTENVVLRCAQVLILKMHQDSLSLTLRGNTAHGVRHLGHGPLDLEPAPSPVRTLDMATLTLDLLVPVDLGRGRQ